MLLMLLYYRMNLCTTVTESDVARAKNALKASLVGQLNGNKHSYSYTQSIHSLSLNHNVVIVLVSKMQCNFWGIFHFNSIN